MVAGASKQEARERATREQGFTGYCELACEAPFYKAMSDVRLHPQEADEHLAVALCECTWVRCGALPCCLSRARDRVCNFVHQGGLG